MTPQLRRGVRVGRVQAQRVHRRVSIRMRRWRLRPLRRDLGGHLDGYVALPRLRVDLRRRHHRHGLVHRHRGAVRLHPLHPLVERHLLLLLALVGLLRSVLRRHARGAVLLLHPRRGRAVRTGLAGHWGDALWRGRAVLRHRRSHVAGHRHGGVWLERGRLL